MMADALRQSGRPIVFSMCEWGTAKPWLWAKNIGNLWRTTGDIFDSFNKPDPTKSWAHTVTDIVDLNEPLWPFAGPGHWNDADMLEVGNGGMTPNRISIAFLALGNDGFAADGGQRCRPYGREHALDPPQQGGHCGRPGSARACRVIASAKDGTSEVWMKPLAGGGRALLLFNRGDEAGDDPSDRRSAWLAERSRAKCATFGRIRMPGPGRGAIEAIVEPHGVMMFAIKP